MFAVLKKVKHKTKIRTRMRSLIDKGRTATFIYRNDGMHGVTKYIKEGVIKRINRIKGIHVQQTGDVLIVTITEPLLERYRTDHMLESLRSTGMKVDKVPYHELTVNHIKGYNIFIFYRVPWLPGYDELLAYMKYRNKVSIYAVDDLVIDTKYTDNLPVVQKMNGPDRIRYNDGVVRHKKLLEKCDYAITTTEGLAKELRKYKNFKQVYIDRNSMSEEMIYCANRAIQDVERDADRVVIGYFSGTNTHNEDFQMIAPVLIKVLQQNDNVYIKITGRVDAPDELKDYCDRLIFTPYVNWRKLPFELRKCDIILSPLVDTLFNRAKSEIKWAESALVEVPVIASDMGAFREVVDNKKTGLLVKNDSDVWYDAIKMLINDKKLRQKIASNARNHVIRNYRTTGNRAKSLRNFISSITPNIIAFGGVSFGAISGGNMVAKTHMDILREAGYIVYGVESMSYKTGDKWEGINKTDNESYDIFRINSRRRSDRVNLAIGFDRFVATFWASVDMVDRYQYMNKNGQKLYLVQNMEADFYELDDSKRLDVLSTYWNSRLQPVTISKWCQGWLKSEFDRDTKYAPNGIDISIFKYSPRDWSNRKIRILIEGDSASEYKKVDESFKIANKLDRSKFEVSYLSYNASPKDWYQVDNVYLKIAYDNIGSIYSDHDILIKSSILESFSYPPLEIMATGGVPILVENDGNAEYVKDGENAIYYKQGDIKDALSVIGALCKDPKRFQQIATAGRKTAEGYSWQYIQENIIDLYK